jgi:Flp pilus assembly pilin Flp
MRKLLGRLLVEDNGQGLVEYTLIVVLVALVFWVAIKNTNIGSGLAAGWSKVTDCVSSPSACDSRLLVSIRDRCQRWQRFFLSKEVTK